MSESQIYCNISELVDALNLTGDEKTLSGHIASASQFLMRRLGEFLPVLDARTLPGTSEDTLRLHYPLLAITSVTVDGTAVTDYTLEPALRWWPNGPYTELKRDDSGSWGEEVVITGLWGLYQELASLGVSVVSQLVGDTTLVLTDGSPLSPGMVILIGSEQELVTAGNGGPRSPAPTLATSQLTAAVDAEAAEDIPVDNGAEFHEGEVIMVGTEDLYIRKIASDTLVCSRGWNGTTKAAHLNNADIYVYRTYTVLRAVNGTTAAAHSTAAISRYLLPADVCFLAKEVAALMRAKEQTAFGGRAGSTDTGETFYVNIFSKDIDQIHANYALPHL